MLTSAALIDMVLRSAPPRPNTEYWLPQEVRSGVREMVRASRSTDGNPLPISRASRLSCEARCSVSGRHVERHDGRLPAPRAIPVLRCLDPGRSHVVGKTPSGRRSAKRTTIPLLSALP